MKKIIGRIIRILDNRTVIINLGTEDGVSGESIFRIMGSPEEVVDPADGRVLGEVTLVKSRVKAKTVAERFTIATTNWRTVKRTMKTFDGLFGQEIQDIDEGELRVDPEQLEPWAARSSEPVAVGDLVEVLINEKASGEGEE